MNKTSRPMKAWHVYRPGHYQALVWIETVYYDSDMSADTVKASLINHDGFQSDITVLTF